MLRTFLFSNNGFCVRACVPSAGYTCGADDDKSSRTIGRLKSVRRVYAGGGVERKFRSVEKRTKKSELNGRRNKKKN